MSTKTMAELHAISTFANQLEEKANEIQSRFNAFLGNGLAVSANWLGEGGSANQSVLNMLENTVPTVIQDLRNCVGAARGSQTTYATADIEQADATRGAHAAASGITSALA